MEIDCPHCSQHLDIPDDAIGATVTCPVCNGEFDIKATTPGPVPPAPRQTSTFAPGRVKLQCAKCRATVYGPTSSAGKTMNCPKCHRNAVFFKVMPPDGKDSKPSKPSKSAPTRTIGESVATVVVRLLLFLCIAAFLGGMGLLASLNGNEKLAERLFCGGCVALVVFAYAWFVWLLACVRTIALCMMDAAAERAAYNEKGN